MKYPNFLILTLSIFVAFYHSQAAPGATNIKSYDVRGIVREISPDHRTARIQHQAIVGYMSAMTMDFNVKDTNELNGISSNDEITFKLTVTDTESWIEGIHFVSHPVENETNNTDIVDTQSVELGPGDLLPDCRLTTEDKRSIRFSDFRGKAVAFTFFFSRCPLPDYCPRMSRNFSETRKLLLATTNAPANWQLLSISFDSAFDNPDVLTYYANFYRNGDANHWLFAVAPTNALAILAPRLDLIIMHDGENILSHNLRTVVLDPQGRIFRQFDGNQWTPQQLADSILEAASGLQHN